MPGLSSAWAMCLPQVNHELWSTTSSLSRIQLPQSTPGKKHATTSNISREAFNVLFRFQNGPNDSCSPKNCKLIPWYFIETTFFQQEFRLLRSTFHPGLWLAICGIYRRYEYIKQPIDIPSYIEVLDNEKHCINCMDVMSWSFMDQQKHTSFNSHDMNPPTSPSCSDEHSAGNHRQDQSATQVATLRHSAKGVLTYTLDLSPSHKYEVL